MFNSDIAALRRSKPDETGVALAIVALVLLLLTVLIVSAHYTIISQTTSTANYRNSTQAFYVAEAGIQRTIEWFSYKYSPASWPSLVTTSYPVTLGGSPVTLNSNGTGNVGSLTYLLSGTTDSFKEYLTAANVNPFTFPGAGSSLQGQYNVTAELLSVKLVTSIIGGAPQRAERWRINSTGRLIGPGGNEIASTENVAIIETLVKPLINHAICANTLAVNGNFHTIDTYDSSQGDYGGPNVQNDASIGSYPSSPALQFDSPGITLGGEIDVSPAILGAFPGICGSAINGCGLNYCPTPPPIPTYCAGTSVNSSSGPFVAKVGGCSFGGVPTCPAPSGFDAGNPSGDITLGLPPGTSGEACFWFNSPSVGTLTIDNITNRIGSGSLNVYVNSLTGGQLKIRASIDNPVRLYVKSYMDLNTTNMNPVPPDTFTRPGNLIILMNNSSGSIKLRGGADAKAVIYIQRGTAIIQDNGDSFYGAIITDTMNGKGRVHYDRSLEKNFGAISNFMPNAEVRRIY